jgi:hypothetical protein
VERMMELDDQPIHYAHASPRRDHMSCSSASHDQLNRWRTSSGRSWVWATRRIWNHAAWRPC